MKKLFIACLALLSATSANLSAQNDKKESKEAYSSYYVELLGGMTTPMGMDNSDLKKHVFGLSIGRHFSPIVGARLNVLGTQFSTELNNGYLENTSKFKYINTNLDLHVRLFGLQNLNFYVLGGVGLNYAWDRLNDEELLAHNWRLGAKAEYRVFKNLGISIECDFDNRSDDFVAPYVGGTNDKWVMSAMAGLSFHFGHSSKTPYDNPYEVVNEVRALSLYEQMQARVQTRMDNWMKRMKGEKKDAYRLRTSTDSLAAVRLQYEKEESTKMAGDLINKAGASLGKYSAKKGKLGVDFDGLPSIVLDVPLDQARKLKSANDLKFKNTVYMLRPDGQYEVLYTEVLTPAESKAYTYDNTKGDHLGLIPSTDYMPLAVMQQTMEHEEKLQSIRDHAMKQAISKNFLTDNTEISVNTEVIPVSDTQYDYKVSCKYEVKDGFSAQDDFAAGKYEAEKSNASVAMMGIIKQAFETDFAQYLKAGKKCNISFTGTADATPIHGKIAYNGVYGDIVDQVAKVNGQDSKLTVTKKNGIRSNEELSLLRAVSVKNYIYNNLPALKNMKTTDAYNIEVSEEEGSEFRRVKVDFYFENAF